MQFETVVEGLYQILKTQHQALTLGLALSGIGLVYMKITGIGGEYHPALQSYLVFRGLFDRRVFGPLDKRLSRYGLSLRTRALLTIGAFGIMVLVGAVVTEISLLFLTAGTVLASHYYLGVTISPTPLFHLVVYLVVMSTTVLMYYANRRVYHGYYYA